MPGGDLKHFMARHGSAVTTRIRLNILFEARSLCGVWSAAWRLLCLRVAKREWGGLSAVLQVLASGELNMCLLVDWDSLPSHPNGLGGGGAAVSP